MTSTRTVHYAAFGIMFLVLALGVGSFVAHAQEVPPPPPPTCSETQHLENDVCVDNQVAPPTCSETQHLENDVCVDNAVVPAEPPVVPQTEVATSTDGTGGLFGGTIVTGDAMATTSVENELNTNIVDINDTCPPDSIELCDNPGAEMNSGHLTASTTNEAILGSASETLASTGENVADGGTSIATIVTGNAVSTANVINIVNTNIFNSDGLVLFLNQLFGGGLDLRDFNLSYFFDGEAGASQTTAEGTGEPQCTLLTCLNSSTLNVVNTNTATVTNSVIVRAATGENMASTTGDGSALIDTGDAYAAANVVNLVNTNIINSSYLLVSFNNFGNLAGDITLPSADFFTDLFAHGGAAPEMNSSTYGVNNTNLVDFTGTTTAEALTGDNLASSTESMATTTDPTGAGNITTGDAYSSASTFTDANATYVGGTSVFLLFHVLGDWTGEIRGLPEGMSWARTESGDIVVMSDNSGIELPEAPNANCDEDTGPVSNCFNSSHFLASSTSTAHVENNIDVLAETGDNEALTENGTSTVSTGDAYAAANVVNLINTNIVGRNWIFAVFNVLGDWSGDISFGQSDLRLEAVAEAASTPALPGSDVTYRFTVANNGDADADAIVLNTEFDKKLLTFATEGDVNALDAETGVRWNLGRVARGETRDFLYTARIGDIPGGTAMTIPLTATVSSNGTSAEGVLFTLVTIDVVSPPPPPPPSPSTGGGGGGGGGGAGSASTMWSPNPEISVVKTANVGTTTAPTTIDYKVVVTNAKTAGPAYKGFLTDTLYDPKGSVMYKRSWDLETIASGDQITLTYTVEFASSTKPGVYHNVARVTGRRNSVSGDAITPIEGSKEIEFGSLGLVLGLSTSTPVIATSTPALTSASCAPLLTSYLRPWGKKNAASEVMKLQAFLNSAEGSKLPTTGFFGPMTNRAVKSFQSKYASEILTPLGLKKPTGNVFSATQRKINAVACGGIGPIASVQAR